MTVEVKHPPSRGRIALTGDGSGGPDQVADLAELCRSVAELARTSTRPPRRIRLEHLGTAIEVEWDDPGAPDGGGVQVTDGQASSAEPEPQDGLHHVCAPMIGTYYHAPEPGAPPFVAVGDTVTAGQPIGILEVMKMMSPVEADIAGRVVEILAADGAAVEFQQRLIAVEPA
ncbi:biotin/lipoyl-containing protein [Kitasatospora sp. CB02891]|uniref:acetyl-CoA carboxylase biotin carboxyl carrier protein n=1 Tax=Kitasatospora sp. CB02891 TaxID=2020329 RepID=UPI000C28079E|nr:biotin/lipoyl-containing protein [Kitasatospora sp. CB02891]PJN29214.1 acetyl-CoA carboxylase biotin carboxyl carrier protein subunit [Kitasatospora sp. CB02891]